MVMQTSANAELEPITNTSALRPQDRESTQCPCHQRVDRTLRALHTGEPEPGRVRTYPQRLTAGFPTETGAVRQAEERESVSVSRFGSGRPREAVP